MPQQSKREAFEIRTLAAGLSALVVLLALDLERTTTRQNREAARLRLAVATLASAWAPVLTLVAGRYAHPQHWCYVQPFAGGAGFVVMQAAGWMLHAAVLCAFMVSFMNFDKALQAPRGAALALGCTAAAAQLTLNASLDRFRATPREIVTNNRKHAALSALAGMLVGAAAAMSALADEALAWTTGTLRKQAAPALVVSACGCLGLAAFATHAVHGPLVRAHYAPWMPFRGGQRFVLLHACAWTLVGVVCDVLLAVGPTSIAMVRGGPLIICAIGGVTNAALIVALDYFDGAPLETKQPARTPSSLIVARLFVFCSIVVYYAPGLPHQWIAGRGAPAAYVTATLMAHLAPLLAHGGAALNIGTYSWFMVGAGGPTFVIAQGCGWMMYAFSLLFSGATLFTRDSTLGLLASPLAVLSAGLLVASVSLFESHAEPREREPEPWRVQCDVQAFEDLDAAAEDLYVLREAAATPASRALLRAAARALEEASQALHMRASLDELTEDDEPVALGCSLDADGGVLRRRRYRRDAFLKALPIVAAPSATALGALLLHAAESSQDDGRAAPLLAACALLATLFAAPLQYLGGKTPPVARAASLAAWSFAVLAALLAVLRPQEHPQLAACGWVGVFLQGLALASGSSTEIERRASSSSMRKLTSLASSVHGSDTVLDAPEDIWARIEAHLASRDLGALAASSKAPQWCAAYTTPPRWRRRLAQLARGDIRAAAKATSPRVSSLPPPRRRADGGTLDWKFACFLRDRGAPLLRCCRCGEVDAIVDLSEIRLAPCSQCGRSSAAHRRCLEEKIGVRPVSSSDVRGEDVGACTCGTAFDAGTRAPDWNASELGACILHEGHRLRRAMLRLCADALVAFVFCAKLRAFSIETFVAACQREPPPLRAAFVLWLTLQVALLRVVRSDAYSDVLSTIWQHRPAVAGYLALYAFHVVAFAMNVAAFSPLPLFLWGPRCVRAPLVDGAAVGMLLLGSLVSVACLAAFGRTIYLVLTVADLAEPAPAPRR